MPHSCNASYRCEESHPPCGKKTVICYLLHLDTLLVVHALSIKFPFGHRTLQRF